MTIKAVFTLGLIALGTMTSSAGETGEKSVIGYVNGKPIYGRASAAAVRSASVTSAPATAAAPAVARPQYVAVQTQNRVHVGCTQMNHGPAGARANSYDSSPGPAYGYSPYYGASGYDYQSNGQCYTNGACPPPAPAKCQTYVNPYPAAASRGYSWVPRYSR
jgi:hypothetical protein